MKKVTLLIVLLLILALSACKLPAPGGGIPTETTVSDSAASATPGAAPEATKPPEKGQPSPTPEQPLAVTATPAPTQEAAAGQAATATPAATATNPPQAVNLQAKRIEFKAGTDSATQEGVLNGGETLTYILTAKKGQTMQVEIWSPNSDVFLAVSGASSGQVLAQAADKKDSWGGTLPQDEDYYVSLTAAGGQTSYALTVKIPALATGKATPSGTVFDPYTTYGKPNYEDKMAGGSLLEWAKAETGKLPDNNSLQLEFKDGKLYVTGKQVDFSTWWFSWHSLKDFYIEMTFDAQQCEGSDAYGTIIRGPEHLAGQSYGYVAAFSCEGNYWIFRLDDADPWDATDLVSWAKSDAINTGVKAQNILGIRAEGKTLTFFANGYQIAQVSDDEYSQGRFGVFVRSSEDGDYTYRVLKVAYWELGEE